MWPREVLLYILQDVFWHPDGNHWTYYTDGMKKVTHFKENCTNLGWRTVLLITILTFRLWRYFWNKNCIFWTSVMTKIRTSILKVLLKQYKSPTGHTKFKHATNINIQVKKCSTIPKFELELDFIVLQLYTKFQYNIYNGPKENEQKPFLHWNFLSPRGITPSKSARQYPNSNLS